MSTIKKFEDIDIRKDARSLCSKIYECINKPPFDRDYKLKEQINASSGSIMDNIAEGFERGGNKEFINFLRYAKGSGGETRSQLYRALDRGYITKIEFEHLMGIVLNINARTQNFINYLNQSEFKGPNYNRKT